MCPHTQEYKEKVNGEQSAQYCPLGIYVELAEHCAEVDGVRAEREAESADELGGLAANTPDLARARSHDSSTRHDTQNQRTDRWK